MQNAVVASAIANGGSVMNPYVVDHILPLTAGGPDPSDNRQPAHRVCNRQKSDKVSGISTSQAMRMPFVRDSTFAE